MKRSAKETWQNIVILYGVVINRERAAIMLSMRLFPPDTTHNNRTTLEHVHTNVIEAALTASEYIWSFGIALCWVSTVIRRVCA